MKKINIQKDVDSRNKISMPLPAIVSFDTIKEPETNQTAETINEQEKEVEDVQSEVIQEQEVNENTHRQDAPKKGGRKAKGNV